MPCSNILGIVAAILSVGSTARAMMTTPTVNVSNSDSSSHCTTVDITKPFGKLSIEGKIQSLACIRFLRQTPNGLISDLVITVLEPATLRGSPNLLPTGSHHEIQVAPCACPREVCSGAQTLSICPEINSAPPLVAGRSYNVPSGTDLLLKLHPAPAAGDLSFKLTVKYLTADYCKWSDEHHFKCRIDNFDTADDEVSLSVDGVTPRLLSSATILPNCIPAEWKCDGIHDCSNGIDECCEPTFTPCMSGYVRCARRCDGRAECQSAIDEADCDSEPLPESSFKTNSDDTGCSEPGFFRCTLMPSSNILGGVDAAPSDASFTQNGGSNNLQLISECLPPSRRCNGFAECNGAIDEFGCTAAKCNAANGTFLCTADATGRCIREDFVCDGRAQCPNGEDETYCPFLSRRLNIILCISAGVTLCSIIFVIVYFRHRYASAAARRASRAARHQRRRRLEFMSPVEQATRYFMHMCGAPPSYTQVVGSTSTEHLFGAGQPGGPAGPIDDDDDNALLPPPQYQDNGQGFGGIATTQVDAASTDPDQEACNGSVACSEAEYITNAYQTGSNEPSTQQQRHVAVDIQVEMGPMMSQDGQPLFDDAKDETVESTSKEDGQEMAQITPVVETNSVIKDDDSSSVKSAV